MTKTEIIAAQCQFESLHEDVAVLRGLQGIFNGTTTPGLMPELVAKAVREGFSIPLKYTQSYASLRSLYEYAAKNKDTKLIQWTTNQIYQILGQQVLEKFQSELRQKQIMTVDSRSSRKRFISQYRNMNIFKLQRFQNSLPPDSFYRKALERFTKVNLIRAEITNQSSTNLPLDSFAETIRFAFANNKQTSFINEMRVSPYVVVTCLVEANTKRMNWEAIMSSQYLRKGLVIKKLSLPPDVIEKLLVNANAPQTVIDKILG
ncbi:hypothetical protein GPJ56_010466 [Histomonas meleagridis]|uniref:uncharacterized protein n=1 Tax=Histomonas meleagridis TaxID=135588 RepID=UPI00355A8A0A|nr:hypothetical protein GPJ56_010466 [Histomonas meleagridis]KAH0798057.1 hypothetical protein GO595_009170 [Histomonas meleagridis]